MNANLDLTSSTEIEDDGTCAGLAAQHVKVEGTAQADGSVSAREIEVENSAEIDHEGDGGGDSETPTLEPTETPEPTPAP